MPKKSGECLLPKTFGECLFLLGLGAAFLFGCVNFVISSLGLISSYAAGLRYGFDLPIMIFCVFFAALFAVELSKTLSCSSERILSARWPNALAAAVSLVWSLFAVLIILFLFDSGLDIIRNNYWWGFLVTAVVILIANIPSLIFHLALCFKKYRDRVFEIHNELERKMAENGSRS